MHAQIWACTGETQIWACRVLDPAKPVRRAFAKRFSVLRLTTFVTRFWFWSKKLKRNRNFCILMYLFTYSSLIFLVQWPSIEKKKQLLHAQIWACTRYERQKIKIWKNTSCMPRSGHVRTGWGYTVIELIVYPRFEQIQDLFVKGVLSKISKYKYIHAMYMFNSTTCMYLTVYVFSDLVNHDTLTT